MSSASLAEGTLFAGRYRVVRCIAAGGMGAVHEVTHVETERRRALKVMHAQFLQSQELRDRFRQEARVAAQIESEFIVDVFDAGIDEATQMPFLVMELLKGEELGKLLHRRGRLSPAEVVTYLHQAALALDKTHRAQIVHRDLKPENLFLTEREDGAPRIKILDFGIAKVVADSGTNVNATRSIGTPLYMAPEQFKPGHRVSPAADLYALSMMAYTLLVGKTYWAEEAEGGNVFAFAGVAMMGPRDPATARARRAGAVLRPAFDAWFARATAFQPEARYPSATATVAGLAEALGVPVPGFSASGPQDAGQTQLLGSPESPSSPGFPPGFGSSGPTPAGLHGRPSGLHGSDPQGWTGGSPSTGVSGLHASSAHAPVDGHGSGGPPGLRASLHGSGPHGGADLGASGRASGFHGSGPQGVDLHGSGPLPSMVGTGAGGVHDGYPGGHPALHTSASGALSGTLAGQGAVARPRSAVLKGIVAGVAVCLCGLGAVALVVGPHGLSGRFASSGAPATEPHVAPAGAPPGGSSQAGILDVNGPGTAAASSEGPGAAASDTAGTPARAPGTAAPSPEPEPTRAAGPPPSPVVTAKGGSKVAPGGGKAADSGAPPNPSTPPGPSQLPRSSVAPGPSAPPTAGASASPATGSKAAASPGGLPFDRD